MSALAKTKRTLDDFITLARQVHGVKFDYSTARYLNHTTPLQIICPEHGAFMQSPGNHLAGKGCRKCASKAAGERYRKTFEEFQAEAKKVHADRYDYSDCEYKSARLKVVIRCKEHGPFEQIPYVHLNGSGCPICGREDTAKTHRSSPEEFVAHGKAKYGDKFDYSRVNYVNAWVPVLIGCPVHGEFSQTPAAHLHNTTYGCPQCAHDDNTNRGRGPRAPRPQDRKNTADFIKRANEVHAGKYDYSKTEYVTSSEPVTIVCEKHGAFSQVASGHLSGRGCPKCGNDANSTAQRQSVEEFIARARELHGAKYDYSKVVYESARLPVTIICPVHGEFKQVPDKHLKGGCRKCADDELPGAYSTKVLTRDPALAGRTATLYYLLFASETGERFYKIGITLTSIKQRFAGYGSAGYQYTVLREKRLSLLEAFEAEQAIVDAHVKTHQYSPVRGNREGAIRFGGRKECFSVPLPQNLVALLDCPLPSTDEDNLNRNASHKMHDEDSL